MGERLWCAVEIAFIGYFVALTGTVPVFNRYSVDCFCANHPTFDLDFFSASQITGPVRDKYALTEILHQLRVLLTP
jgi:hypothetical protein